MFFRKYKEIMEKSEEQRNKWALGLSVFFTLIIFVAFAFYKGYLNFESKNIIVQQKNSTQTANVLSADAAPSPIQNTKETFKAAFVEINKKFQEFKDSVSSVLVPFVTSIEVYERN
jgi:hypothetical protein